MASSGTLTSGCFGEDRSTNSIGSCWNLRQTYSDSIVKGIQNRWCRRNNRLLPDSLRSERAKRRFCLNQNRLNRRNVASRRNQIVVEIFSLPRKELFHQCHA